MAATPLEFSLDVITGLISASQFAFQSFSVRDLFSGDIVPIHLHLVESNVTGDAGSYTQISPTGLTVQIAIGLPGNILTSVTLTPVADAGGNGYFTGNLPLNVAAVSNLWTGGDTAPKTGYRLAVQVSDGVNPQSFAFPLTLQLAIITPTLQNPAPPDTALGSLAASQIYIPRDDSGATGFYQYDIVTKRKFYCRVQNGEFSVSEVV